MRRHEYFKIQKFIRRYDRQSGKFIYDISYKTAADVTPRTIGVSEAFGLGIDETREYVIYDNLELKIDPTDIIYLTGDSGSGKSVLLRELKKDLGADQVTDITEVTVDADKPLIEQVGKDFNEGLMLLSLVGLGDAFLFVRRYRELSDGQKYRFRLAKAIESGKQYWFADEFCATLDRETAKIVAFNIQKHARRLGKSVVVATTHTDLFEDLKPSVHIHKGLGKKVQVNYYPNEINNHCSVIKDVKIEEGTRQDWRELAFYHYRSHNVPPTRKIFRAVLGDEVIGVIVYSHPAPAVQGRKEALGRILLICELKDKLSLISRVVVHPKYRSVGLGQKLVCETLPLAGTPYVEAMAVMAKYNPFFEKAGMRLIKIQQPSKEAEKIRDELIKYGFDIERIGSQKYNLQILLRLREKEVQEIKQFFIDNIHPRFTRYVSGRRFFCDKKLWAEKIQGFSLERLAGIIRVAGLLCQTKAYLFWSRLSIPS